VEAQCEKSRDQVDPVESGGLTQQIISALGRFGELRILARGETSTYKGRGQSTTNLERALGVDI
jgi:TolB-like protein